MARAILLTFKDNEAAEAFIKKVLVADQSSYDNAHLASIGAVLVAHGKIEWAIARPTAYCKCKAAGRNHKIGWTKTPKFGWFVHTKCKKVNYFVARDFIKNLRVGYNDLLPDLQPPEIVDVHIMPNASQVKSGEFQAGHNLSHLQHALEQTDAQENKPPVDSVASDASTSDSTAHSSNGSFEP